MNGKKFAPLVCTLGIVAISLLTTGCQDRADAGGMGTGPAKLEIVGGDTINWGEVGVGQLEHTLKLYNSGHDTLFISEVKPSCGCTTAGVDKEQLVFGDTATIDLTMDVTHAGEVQKTLRITTNDSAAPVRTVFLKANVVQEIAVEPGYFSVGPIKTGQAGTSSLVLRNTSQNTITVQPPKAGESTLMDVKFDMKNPVTLKPGDSLKVNVTAITMNPSPAPVTYNFETDSKITPKLRATLNVSTMPDDSQSVGTTGSGE